MIIIGGEQQPIERVKLARDPFVVDDEENYYAKNVVAATVQSISPRIGETVPWPVPVLDPEDARGWYVSSASYDETFLSVDYEERTVTALRVGPTFVTFDIENADGTLIPVSWGLAIRDALRPLTVQITPSADFALTVGDALIISATADGGDGPYVYTFTRNGVVMKTGGEPFYNVGVTDWNDEGVYAVSVRDHNNSVSTSTRVKVALNPQPLTLPGGTSDRPSRVQLGEIIEFYAVALGGRPPLTFEWFKDGVPLNVTGQRLTIPAADATDEGNYTFTVSDIAGQTATSPYKFVLTVVQEQMGIVPVNADAIAATKINPDGSYAIQLDAGFKTVLLFQAVGWSIGDPAKTPIPGFGTGATLTGFDANLVTFDTTGLSDGQFRLRPKAVGTTTGQLHNAADDAQPAMLALNLISLPVFGRMPKAASMLIEGTPETISAAMANTLFNPRYQWQKLPAGASAWQDITGATALSYTVPAVHDDNNGDQYRVIATNDYGSTTSDATTITVGSFSGFVTSSINSRNWLAPGGVYDIDAAVDYGDALQDPGTTIAWTLDGDAADLKFISVKNDPNSKTRGLITVADNAPKISNRISVRGTATNANGDTPITATDASGTYVNNPTPVQSSDPIVVTDSAPVRVAFDVDAAFPRDTGGVFNVTGVMTPDVATFGWDDSAKEIVITAGGSGTGTATITLTYLAPGVTPAKTMHLTSSLNVQAVSNAAPELVEDELVDVEQGVPYDLKWKDPSKIASVGTLTSSDTTRVVATYVTSSKRSVLGFKQPFDATAAPVTVTTSVQYRNAAGALVRVPITLTVKSVKPTTRSLKLVANTFTGTTAAAVRVQVSGYDTKLDSLTNVTRMSNSTIQPSQSSYDQAGGSVAFVFNTPGVFKGKIQVGVRDLGSNGTWWTSEEFTITVT